MPPWLIDVAATGGPAVSVLMTLMWWLERKEHRELRVKHMKMLEDMPDRLMKHADDRREADKLLIDNFKKLTRAVWANIKGRGRSLPPTSGEDDV